MTEAAPIVFVVDDDASVRVSLKRLIGSIGIEIQTFPSAQAFLNSSRRDAPACIVLDVRLPDLNGLELQHKLMGSGADIPIVFITGHGDIPMSVRAMKAGAVDFLTKPFGDQALLDSVQKGIERHRALRRDKAEIEQLQSKYQVLTPREREVFALVVSGLLNKQIAALLGTGEKTIKVHRGQVMQKMGAKSLANLVRIADKLRPVSPKY
jgi:FixJ family two-component response regulator